MADEEKKDQKAEKSEDKKKKKKSKDKSETKSGGGLMKHLIIGVVVVIVSAGAGAGTGHFMTSGGDETPVAEEGEVKHEETDLGKTQGDRGGSVEDFEYYKMDSLTVNLNVRHVNRYLKATIVLGIAKSDYQEVSEKLDKHKIILMDQLRTYLAGHSLERVSGEKNPRRIKREIRDLINRQVWPDSKPNIDHVLFDDWAIQ